MPKPSTAIFPGLWVTARMCDTVMGAGKIDLALFPKAKSEGQTSAVKRSILPGSASRSSKQYPRFTVVVVDDAPD